MRLKKEPTVSALKVVRLLVMLQLPPQTCSSWTPALHPATGSGFPGPRVPAFQTPVGAWPRRTGPRPATHSSLWWNMYNYLHTTIKSWPLLTTVWKLVSWVGDQTTERDGKRTNGLNHEHKITLCARQLHQVCVTSQRAPRSRRSKQDSNRLGQTATNRPLGFIQPSARTLIWPSLHSCRFLSSLQFSPQQDQVMVCGDISLRPI